MSALPQTLTIDIAPERELEEKALTLPEQARAMIIRDQATYETASEKLLGVAELRKEIAAHWAPLKQAAHESHHRICTAEKTMLAPVEAAEAILKRGIGTYRMEQERLRLDAERIAREVAERAAAEALEASIEAAEAEGASPEEVRAIIEQPRPASVVYVAPTVLHVKGVSMADSWKAQVTNLLELVKAVAEGRAPVNLVMPNETALGQIARATKGSMAIPGVRIFNDPGVRAGRR